MRLNKKQYNEIVSRLETLEKTINKGGGNPYHDELGRFAESPVKAFGEYYVEPTEKNKPGFAENYRLPGEKEGEIHTRLDENDYKALMTVDAVLSKVGADLKDKDPIDAPIKSAIDEYISNINFGSNMHSLYDISAKATKKKLGGGADPEEMAQLEAREKRLKDTTASIKKHATENLSKLKDNPKAAAKVKAVLAAVNTLDYLAQKAMDSEELYKVNIKKLASKSKNSLGDKANNLIAKMEKIINGGRGSGNFGHSGRPGKVGGSGTGKGKIEIHEGSHEMEHYYATSEDGTILASGTTPEETLDKARRQNLEQARSEYYRDYLKYEKTDDGQYVRKKPDSNDKAYKESLAKIKSLTEEIRKSDAKSDDLQTQKDNVKIDRIEEKIGKKALLVAKDFEGDSLSTFMDEDGNEYWYDKRSERVRDYGGDKEYRSPAFDKAMKDKTPWNEYELTGAQIKSKLKGYGINTDGLSVSKGRGGYETAWHISGSGLKTDLKAVEDIVKTKIGHVDYDERSGEILAGGNTYVFVSDKDR